MTKKNILFIFFYFSFFSTAGAKSLVDIYGTREVNRFVKVRGSSTDVSSLKGEKIEFEKSEVVCPSPFLNFDKGIYLKAVYKFKKVKYGEEDQDEMEYSPLMYGPDEEATDTNMPTKSFNK